MTGLLSGVMCLPIINLIRYGANTVHAIGGDDEPWDFNTEFRGWLADQLGDDAAKWIAAGASDWQPVFEAKWEGWPQTRLFPPARRLTQEQRPT